MKTFFKVLKFKEFKKIYKIHLNEDIFTIQFCYTNQLIKNMKCMYIFQVFIQNILLIMSFVVIQY